MAQAAYSRTTGRDTTNTNDNIYRVANAERMLLALTANASGYDGIITIGTSFQTPAVTAPSIATGGVTSAATGAAGVSPNAWISIYGSNLAANIRSLTETDIVNGTMPVKLDEVSVQINNKAAYMQYVSPTQINVLAPNDESTGSVAVTVTNSAGTSNAATTILQSILPGLFTVSNYVCAFRPSDKTIINGTGVSGGSYASAAAAKPGDILELYGTGFGLTDPEIPAGALFVGGYPTVNPVTVLIGGISTNVLWAGLVSAGLNQINITVPAGLPDGDHAVVVAVGGVNSTGTAFLKVSST